MKSAAEIAQHLMAIESTTGSEGRVINAMTDLLRSQQWDITSIPVSADRSCILARAHPDPAVTFSTHLDTVPPYIAPVLEGDRLSGRGACDAKGIAASMILAANRLRDEGVRVALLFVVGEETTHDGAKAANHWAAANLTSNPRVLINGEPKESTLGLLPPRSSQVPSPNAGFCLRTSTMRRVQCSSDVELCSWASTLVTWWP